MLEGGQDKEDARRNEVFWNETLAPDQIDRLLSPKVLTNFKRYDKDGEHPVTELSLNDNLIIKGNNLLALHTFRKVYAGKVKLIYIDPPYNTGTDSFKYNDSFNHSTWLTFMRNRLEVARDILSNDGSIFISIDQNEIAYLVILMDEIFGKDNRKNIVSTKRGSVTGAKVINPGVVNISEYVLIYSRNFETWKPSRAYMSKDLDSRYSTFIENFEEGYEKWTFKPLLEVFAERQNIPKSKLKKELGDNFDALFEDFVYKNADKICQPATLDENSISKKAVEIKTKSEKEPTKIFYFKRENNKPYFIIKGKLILFLIDRLLTIDGKVSFAQPVTDIWDDVLPNDLHNEGGIALRKGKKPEKLISRIVEIGSNENDIVMDFFVGSGTTTAVAQKMKRRYIGIEQLDYIEELPVARLVNTINGEQSGISKAVNWQGGGSFVYCELSQANQEFIDQIQAAKSSEELQAIWQTMQERAFLSYKLDPKTFDANKNEFASLAFADQQRFLVEVLDKNLLYVPYSEIDDASYAVSEEDKKLNRQFFNL